MVGEFYTTLKATDTYQDSSNFQIVLSLELNHCGTSVDNKKKTSGRSYAVNEPFRKKYGKPENFARNIS